MTFNTAFKHLYEKELKPYGFQKAKGKRPYFIRMIGDEIFHMITYRNCWSERPYKEFEVRWGVGTVYREKIDLDCLPDETVSWTKSVWHPFVYRDLSLIQPGEPYEIGRNDVNMETELEHSINVVKQNILPKLEKVETLETCYQYLDTFLFDEENFDGDFREYNEGLVNFKMFDMKTFEEAWSKKVEYADDKEWVAARMENQVSIFRKYMQKEENYRLVVETLKRRKQENHERLRKHGIAF